MLLTDFVGLVLATAPVIGLLMWERRMELRGAHGAAGVATGVLTGAPVVATASDDPAAWNYTDPRSVALGDCCIGVALHTVLNRGGYDVVITCGGGS